MPTLWNHGEVDIGAVLGLEQLTWGVLLLVVIAAFCAGWIDAVVGGEGCCSCRPCC